MCRFRQPRKITSNVRSVRRDLILHKLDLHLTNFVDVSKATNSVDETLETIFGTITFSLADRFNTLFTKSPGFMPGNVTSSISSVSLNMNSAFLFKLTEDDLRSIAFSFKAKQSPGADNIK